MLHSPRTAVVLALALSGSVLLGPTAQAEEPPPPFQPFGPDHVCTDYPMPVSPGGGHVDPWVPDVLLVAGGPSGVVRRGQTVYASVTGFDQRAPVTVTHTYTVTTTTAKRVKVGDRHVVRKVTSRVTRSAVIGRPLTDCWGAMGTPLVPVQVVSTGTLRLEGTTWKGARHVASVPIAVR